MIVNVIFVQLFVVILIVFFFKNCLKPIEAKNTRAMA